MLDDEKFQQNASKFAIFLYKRKTQVVFAVSCYAEPGRPSPLEFGICILKFKSLKIRKFSFLAHICLESNLVNFEIPEGLITVLGSF